MSGARRASRAGRAAARLLIGLAGAAAAIGGARAQDLPEVVSPLRVEPDVNGVNLATGRIAIDPPVLAVPAAPNLRFDRVQNAAPYMTGRTIGPSSERRVHFAIHTGAGGSEAFRCVWGVCESVTGTGSTLVGAVYAQAGTGIEWNFTHKSHDTTHLTSGSSAYYAASVVHPNGERLDYSYQNLPDDLGRRWFRPTTITSNLGYHIAIAYQSNDFYADGWFAPREAALYRAGATPVLLRRFTYVGHGSPGTTMTATDWGNSAADVGGRVYSCSACSNMLGADLEVWAGSLRLPGETSPTLEVAQTSQIAQHMTTSADLVGRVTRDGVAWTYTYGNLRREHFAYRYDSVTVTGPNGYRRVYGLTPWDGQIVTSVEENVTESTIRETRFRYDTASRPDQITYPELNQVTLLYDDFGNVISRTTTPKPTSGQNAVTEAASYPTGCAPSDPLRCYRPTSSRDALGRQTAFVHNAAGQLTERTDPADREGVSRKTYIGYAASAAGISRRSVVRVCGTGAACGTSAEVRTEYVYWGNTLLPAVERRIAGGVTLATTYSYDSAGRVLSIDGPLTGTGDTTYFRYDAFGRRIREVGPLGANGVRIVQLHHYRASDDQVFRTETGTLVNPDDVPTEWRQVEYGYDERRNRDRETVTSVNPAGTSYHSVVQRRFDERGRVECEARRMNPAQLATSLLPASACDRDSTGSFGPDRIRRFVYDAAGQLLREYRAWGVTTANGFPATLQQVHAAYAYTPNGQRLSVTDANGNRAELRYDGFDRLARWVFPSRTTDGAVNEADYESYTYDAAGNRLTLRKRDGLTLAFQYDQLNRMIRKTVPTRTGLDPTHTRDVFYDYNVRDLMTDARFDGWSGPGVGYNYDGFGRMASSSNNMDGATRQFTYGWDAAGNRTGIRYPNGADFTYAYDSAGRLTGITDADAGAPLFGFTYDVLGRLDIRTDHGAGGVDYGYDRVDRLLSMAHTFAGGAGNVTLGFNYNPASQIATLTRSNDAYVSNTAYDVSRGYSVNGLNQYTRTTTNVTFGYDGNGNLTSTTTSAGTTAYVYDVENRLVGRSGGGESASLRYDPLGRLYEATGPSGTRRFYWDGDAMAAEYTSTGSLAALHLHGSGSGDDPLLWRGGGENRRLHADHQGSIIAITNDAGAAQWINGYDAWGIPNATNGGRFQYTGQIWLGDLGIYHYKGRMYSPTLGRFLQIDPVGYDDQINLYAYVGNDPVNRVDPTGTTCTQAGTQDGGAPRYSCRIDYERIVGRDGAITHRPVEAGDRRFTRFNEQYTAAVNRLAAGDQNRTVTVEAVRGARAFQTTVGQTLASLVERKFIYSERGLNVNRVETGSRIARSVHHAALASSGLGPLNEGQTYVSPAGLNASRADIVHDGGIHSTPQELTGGLLNQDYPLGAIRHQNQYNDAACALLGPGC